jgi:hypothetical protein
MTRPTFAQAKATYINRFTMEHVPAWALQQREDGTYYAPQFETDAEWYVNTVFPGERGNFTAPPKGGRYCESRNQTWPLGKFLAQPFRRAA